MRCVILGLIITILPALAAHPPKVGDDKDAGVVVVAEGAGATADEALKDAFRQAIRQVVGAVVDAEILVKNDEVVSDKVLTYSDGVIKKYEELSKKEEKGLFRVRIKVVVERRSVVAKLKAANVTVRDLDGKGLFAEMVTELEGRKTVKELVAKTLEGFPLNCIEAEVVGKPEVIQKADDGATIKVRVRFSVDQKAYAAFRDRLIKTLDGAKLTKREASVIYKTDRDGFLNGDVGPLWDKKVVSDGKVAIAVCTQITKSFDRTEWMVYTLDDSVRQSLSHVSSGLVAKLSLLDVNGKAVTFDRFQATPEERQDHWYGFSPSPLFPCYDKRGKLLATDLMWGGQRHFVISPIMVRHKNYSNDGSDTLAGDTVAPFVILDRAIKLTLDEVKAIHSIKCELSAGETLPELTGEKPPK